MYIHKDALMRMRLFGTDFNNCGLNWLKVAHIFSKDTYESQSHLQSGIYKKFQNHFTYLTSFKAAYLEP